MRSLFNNVILFKLCFKLCLYYKNLLTSPTELIIEESYFSVGSKKLMNWTVVNIQ
jgi:hypothetical protein